MFIKNKKRGVQIFFLHWSFEKRTINRILERRWIFCTILDKINLILSSFIPQEIFYKLATQIIPLQDVF